MPKKVIEIKAGPELNAALEAHGKAASRAVNNYITKIAKGKQPAALLALETIISAMRKDLKEPSTNVH